ncbi:MAG TPA: DUF349 domain-containing protein, partial [Gammaproteobacteria bacterium]
LCKSETTLANSQKQYQQAREAFRQIGHLPERVANSVRKRFNNACKQYEQRLRSLKNRQQHEQQGELLRKVRLCQRMERLAVELPQSHADQAAEITDSWISETSAPKPLLQKLEKRLQYAREALSKHAAGETSTAGYTLNQDLERAQLLCIRAEIIADITSPAEAREQRMQYQLSLLGAAMTGGIDTNKPAAEQTAELIGDWISVGPLEISQFDLLETRLKKALDALNKKR